MSPRPGLLDHAAIEAALEGLNGGWSRHGEQLVTQVSLDRYADGLALVVAAAAIAQELDHHPAILLEYGSVTIATTTHDRGGLTELDLELARRLSALLG